MKYTLLLLAVPSFLFSCSESDQIHAPGVQPYFEMVDSEFNADQAYRTVAYVEQYFRVVGNEGFNNSIHYVEGLLQEQGFIEESEATSGDRLTYRIERRPLERPTWEPVSGSLSLGSGESLLEFETNRNLIAINSYSTDGNEEYEVVYAGEGRDLHFDESVEGKVVFAETSVNYLFSEAVLKRGAAGVLAYRMPSYTQPEKNQTSIQFSRVALDDDKKSWGVLLSYAAKEQLKQALEQGNNRINIDLETKIYPSEELTIVAELKGSKYPEDRYVFSAHIQEPGANDNASGVGALAEVAAVSARLLKKGDIDPHRTITYLFGDEIVSTNRFIIEDEERAETIKWGMSLDMVGQDTDKTGGTFLIEKMPDPAAIWTRGEEKHSEWGGRPLNKEDMTPHYFNDFILNRFKEQGKAKDWVVKVNPYEGGSDHVPFLRNDIPGLLLWHFTDQFYHTDNDRIDKVSKSTLKNVGTGALISALVLTGEEEFASSLVLDEITTAAIERLQVEFELSKTELQNGGDLVLETDIMETWADWYVKSIQSSEDILNEPNDAFLQQAGSSVQNVIQEKTRLIELLRDI
ncbi:M28 family peptidase [Gracilimonas halophila]|uniref:M28 family peptidase n=1 Tax=Gracilimonas halophila TaxID=1834464 RepID=A0ABW5JHX4_9BACT